MVFERCSGPVKLLSALGPQMRVRELVVDCCSFSGCGFERSLSTFRECLEVLTINAEVRKMERFGSSNSDEDSSDEEDEYTDCLYVSALKDLHKLQSLHLQNYTALGLEQLLRAVLLKSLRLAGQSCWRQPTSEELEEMAEMEGSDESGSRMEEREKADESQVLSDSLEFLHIGHVSPDSFLGLVPASFPALQELQLGGISCVGTEPGSDEDNEDEDDAKAHLEKLLSWLTAFPLTVDETFTIKVSNNRFAEHIFSALSPFCSLDGKRLVVCTGGCLTFALIDALSGIPRVSKLRDLQVEADRGAEVQKVKTGLHRNAMVEAVQKFRLTRLVVKSPDWRARLPVGVIATLLMAVQLRRPLEMHVFGKELLCCGDGWGDMRGHELSNQWQEVQRTAGHEGVLDVNLEAVIRTKYSSQMWA